MNADTVPVNMAKIVSPMNMTNTVITLPPTVRGGSGTGSPANNE
jgi:hypothetical protein